MKYVVMVCMFVKNLLLIKILFKGDLNNYFIFVERILNIVKDKEILYFKRYNLVDLMFFFYYL